jgi:hypothetical protein
MEWQRSVTSDKTALPYYKHLSHNNVHSCYFSCNNVRSCYQVQIDDFVRSLAGTANILQQVWEWQIRHCIFSLNLWANTSFYSSLKGHSWPLNTYAYSADEEIQHLYWLWRFITATSEILMVLNMKMWHRVLWYISTRLLEEPETSIFSDNVPSNLPPLQFLMNVFSPVFLAYSCQKYMATLRSLSPIASFPMPHHIVSCTWAGIRFFHHWNRVMTVSSQFTENISCVKRTVPILRLPYNIS